MASTLVLTLVLDHLDSNKIALDGRLICKDAQEHLCLPEQCTAQLSMPLPPAASDAAWQPHVQQAFRQLSFSAKARTLSVAASSGSERNLELAWALLRPCLFPGLLLPVYVNPYNQCYVNSWYHVDGYDLEDPGKAAIAAGHAHLLPWLVRNRCPLHRDNNLIAAAEHLDLEGMKRAVQLLEGGLAHPSEDWLRGAMAEAASRSGGAAIIPKLAWLLAADEDEGVKLQQQRQQQQQQQERQQQRKWQLHNAATGAAASGNLSVLQWLHGQGLNDPCLDLYQWSSALSAALRHGHLHVADWVVAQEGFPQDWQQSNRLKLWPDACRSGRMEPLRWLLRHGVPAHGSHTMAAAEAGNLEAVQLLHERFSVPLTAELFAKAAYSGSVPTATWLLQAGCPMSPRAYCLAAGKGNAAMVLWLAREAGCTWDKYTLSAVIRSWPARSKSSTALLPTVRALVEAGWPHGDGTAYTNSTYSAAARGDLPLLRYLHEEVGVAFEPDIVGAAAQGGCQAMLEWLVGAGCGLGSGYPYARAALNGDLATLSCLHRLGVPFGDASWWREMSFKRCAPFAALRWMVERGAPWDEGEAKDKLEALEDFTLSDDESLVWFKARVA